MARDAKFDAGDDLVGAGLDGGDDDARLGTTSKMVATARSGMLSCDGGVRSETLELRYSTGVHGAALLLHKNSKQGHGEVRKTKGERKRQKGAARTRWLRRKLARTAADRSYSGEKYGRPRGTIERRGRGKMKRRQGALCCGARGTQSITATAAIKNSIIGQKRQRRETTGLMMMASS